MSLPDWIATVLFGMVEGLTEFLPVSSTGHLLLVGQWLSPRSDLFITGIQSGAVLAVLVVFTDRVRAMLRAHRDPAIRTYALKLGAAFLITGTGGLMLKVFAFELPETPGPVIAATLIGGVLILGVERWVRGRPLGAGIGWSVAVAVGVAQLFAAVFPGLSRSGATILTAVAMGVERRAATEFAFLLGVPTLISAGGLELVLALRDPASDPVAWGDLVLGTVVAGGTAFLTVRWLLRFVQTHTFVVFGWYRIVLGLILILFHLA